LTTLPQPERSNCFMYAWRRWRNCGGYLCLAIVKGWPRFYWASGIVGYYRRPTYRYRYPWNILWHKGRVERQSFDH
jgi:hypothetical protein